MYLFLNEKELDAALNKVKTAREALKIAHSLEARNAPVHWVSKALGKYYKIVEMEGCKK